MTLHAPSLAEIDAARSRIMGTAIRTPLIRLPDRDGDNEIWLKLEILQPVGSFKLRGAGNCILSAPPGQLAQGVYTASAGNMAQGVAWMARELGLPAKVFVPSHAPEAKVAAIRNLGATVEKISFEDWWTIMIDNGRAGEAGCFVHPVCDTAVMAGNGTIGLEIAEDLPDVDAVIVPFGGGGLACGIAAALQGVRPAARVIACEVEGAAPLAAALAAGAPTTVEYHRSFIDGIGSTAVLPAMWPVVRPLIAESIVVPVPEIEAALRLMINRLHVIAEGAGATPLAAARRSGMKGAKIVCIVSGSGINFAEVARIMAG
ncbi:MAG: pyridoxal-phosphate dependent enzyme [Alphaproteobacteria bacterium]|nr:pyridoxal-phosphate dependent enzyme [Alphaproteobacteria bacterium]